MIPLLLARIRIPIPDELVLPMTVLGAIMLLVILIFTVRGEWLRMSLAVSSSIVLACVLFQLAAGGYLTAWAMGWRAMQDALLVAVAVLAWRIRAKHFDLPAAAIAAIAYGLCAPLIGMLAGARVYAIQRSVSATVWALCLLAAVALLAPRFKPGWAGVVVGAAAGDLIGSALQGAAFAVAPNPRLLLASGLHGAALGLALAVALRILSLAGRR